MRLAGVALHALRGPPLAEAFPQRSLTMTRAEQSQGSDHKLTVTR